MQNPLQAMQRVGYPEPGRDRAFPGQLPSGSTQKQVGAPPRQMSPGAVAKPPAVNRSPDGIVKPGVPVSSAPPTGHPHARVQVGVVSKPFNLPQQESNPPGQVDMRTVSLLDFKQMHTFNNTVNSEH